MIEDSDSMLEIEILDYACHAHGTVCLEAGRLHEGLNYIEWVGKEPGSHTSKPSSQHLP